MFDNFPTILLSFKWMFSFHGSLIGGFKIVFFIAAAQNAHKYR